MSEDFYPFVDSGDPPPDNAHITTARQPKTEAASAPEGAPHAAEALAPESALKRRQAGMSASYATRIAIYDDMLSTPRVIVIAPNEIRTYLEEITNTVYRCMREQGGRISLMVIREIVENFIHANFVEPIISILDDGNTIRFADQGPGIGDKERAFDFGVTSADQNMKRYIRGTGAGFPMVQQYLETSGGVVSIEDNMSAGTVVTISVDVDRAREIDAARERGAAVRGGGARGRREAAARPYEAQSAREAVPGISEATGRAHRDHVGERVAWPTGETWGARSEPFVSRREHQALSFLLRHGQAGPTELVAEFGYSGPTWSRELATLNQCGLVVKRGQKYILTESGAAWIGARRDSAL
ncbi:ATP-binding region ATPase domain protein [Coriobacterium glomerans PW2]|uniref:ATP-binding region ATPase domain protein n=1 Tax=Coriobacterium glomerans (strain ATCC 49209 / DSM 20642 / JCM 10262 / PW2) TaxID=700015 RepID=F2N6T3_CORGP|nr:ATP-binding protein [Coriobacterium glomerans]AEB06132.1 ATP-binding region ATPase domain protein [Coriobacterium glomerans PW2]